MCEQSPYHIFPSRTFPYVRHNIDKTPKIRYNNEKFLTQI